MTIGATIGPVTIGATTENTVREGVGLVVGSIWEMGRWALFGKGVVSSIWSPGSVASDVYVLICDSSPFFLRGNEHHQTLMPHTLLYNCT